ncbi:MAG: DNA gyrase inhibitor YacG [Phycisphaerales bacterium]
MDAARRFTCPKCKRSVELPKEGSGGLPRFFPFCSERCKLIDLGAWFDADYRIPDKPGEDADEPPARPGNPD